MDKATEVEDWVADDLARTVEGDVAAAIAFKELDAAFLQQIGRGNDVRSFGIPSQRDDGVVLKQ